MVWLLCCLPFLFLGFSHIIKKLKDLVPVLLNSFQEFIPSVRATPNLDGKSSACMLLILNGIDLIIKSFVYGTDPVESLSSNGDPGVMIWDDSISSLMLKKLFSFFPQSPVHNESEKVFFLCFCFLNLFTGRKTINVLKDAGIQG